MVYQWLLTPTHFRVSIFLGSSHTEALPVFLTDMPILYV